MAVRINTNLAALNALRHLTQTDRMLQRNIERLSSGLRINRAADDPAGLAISERFRARIAGLKQAVDNSEIAIAMIGTAEGALTEVHAILTSMRDLAVHAANAATTDPTQLAADQAQIRSSIDALDRIASTTQFGTRLLLDGSGDNVARVVSGGGTDLRRAEGSTLSQGGHTITVENVVASRASVSDLVIAANAGFDPTLATPAGLAPGAHTVVVTAATAASIQSGTGLDGNQKIAEGAVLTINDGTTDYLVTFEAVGGTANTAQNIADEINADAGAAFTASVQADGSIRIATDAVGGTQRLLLSVDGIGITEAMLDMDSLTGVNGTDASASLDGGPSAILSESAGMVLLTDGKGGSLTLAETAAAQADFHSATIELTVIGATFDVRLDNGATHSMVAGRTSRVSSGVSGGGSVNLTFGPDVVAGSAALFTSDRGLVFQVGANAGQTVKIGLANMAASTLGGGIANASGYESLAEIDLTSARGATDAITIIDAAIDAVSGERAELGAFQLNTLESNLASLRIAAENLAAADSVIRDADIAEEVVAFTKNQILLQAGTAVLAQANLIPQTILQLLG